MFFVLCYRIETVNVTSSNIATSSTTPHVITQNKRHKNVLKIFAVIAFLFIFSNAFALFANALSEYFPVIYIYFINNVGKPVIVYLTNSRFRKEVHTLLPIYNNQ